MYTLMAYSDNATDAGRKVFRLMEIDDSIIEETKLFIAYDCAPLTEFLGFGRIKFSNVRKSIQGYCLRGIENGSCYNFKLLLGLIDCKISVGCPCGLSGNEGNINAISEEVIRLGRALWQEGGIPKVDAFLCVIIEMIKVMVINNASLKMIKLQAQQVNSAGALTIAVPPSIPPGSPR